MESGNKTNNLLYTDHGEFSKVNKIGTACY